MYKAAVMIVSAIILLQGCSSFSVKQQRPADVTSSPSGATVYASGTELGKTPLRYNLYEAFPGSWVGMIYQAQGVLMVKKDGCEDYTLNVNDYVLSNPIHAELKCSTIDNTEKSTTVKALLNGIEKRLEELDALYNKGVITEDEYKVNRERILNEI